MELSKNPEALEGRKQMVRRRMMTLQEFKLKQNAASDVLTVFSLASTPFLLRTGREQVEWFH